MSRKSKIMLSKKTIDSVDESKVKVHERLFKIAEFGS